MKIKFRLNIGAYSINNWTYASRKVITTQAREWIQDVVYAASAPAITAELAKVRSAFDPKKYSIGIRIVENYPESSFYTKNGTISGHTFDKSNIEKPLIDILFLPKFHGSFPPETFQNLNIDDKFITHMTSVKKPVTAGGLSIDITIWLISRPKNP
jgi:hypothetical protein